MDKILNTINNNEITFLNSPTNREIQKLIKCLEEQNKPKIIFTALHDENLKTLSAQLKHNKITNQLLLSKEEKIITNLILCTSDILYYLFLADNNLADIIIFYDSEVENNYYYLIWQLWKQNKKLRIPRLIMINQGYQTINYPLEANDENTIKYDEKKIEIKYGKNNYPRNSKLIIDDLLTAIPKIDKKDIYQTLVLVPHKRFISIMVEKLREKIKNTDIYSFDENIYYSTNAKVFSPLDNTRIIVTHHSCATLLHLEKLYNIYDSCQFCYLFYGNYQVQKITKKTANHIAREAKKSVYRAVCEDEFFNYLPVEKKYMSENAASKLVLAAYYYDYDISLHKETEIIKHLERINLIRAGKVTKKSKTVFESPLSVQAGHFVYQWYTKKLPLFPGLILANIIDNCKNNLLYTPTVKKEKNEPVGLKNPKNKKSIVFYLDIFLRFFTEFKDIKVEKSKIEGWCQTNSIHAQTFNFLIQQLIIIINYYRKFYNFELALFDSQKVLEKAKPIISFNYSENIYRSHDKINHIYHNNLGETSVLDKKRFSVENFYYPEKFINLYHLNSSSGHNIVLFYLVLED